MDSDLASISPDGRESRSRRRVSGRLVGILVAVLALTAGSRLFAQEAEDGANGHQLPRFDSLKSGEVNVRGGPSLDNPIVWRYKRAGLPVEVIQEFDDWRKIRDWEGAEGWVKKSLLSPRRTVLIMPWASSKDPVEVRVKPAAGARVTAYVQPLVQGGLEKCGDGWCQISGREFSGWIAEDRLWGVEANEKYPP